MKQAILWSFEAATECEWSASRPWSKIIVWTAQKTLFGTLSLLLEQVSNHMQGCV